MPANYKWNCTMHPDDTDQVIPHQALPDWVVQWLQDPETRSRLAASTRAHYAHDMEPFLAYAAAQNWRYPADLTAKRIQAYLTTRHQAGMHPKSIKRHLASIRGLIRYLIAHAQIPADTANGIKTPSVRRTLPALLEVETMHELLEQPATDFHSARDLAMAELLYASALRVAELQRLQIGDFNRDQSTVSVMGKGQKARVVPVGRKAWIAHDRYAQFRAEQLAGLPPTTHWFINPRGKPLTIRSIQYRIARLGHQIGQAIHPHVLRHCCASHLLGSSGDLRAVQEMLGHARLSSTEIYTHLAFEQLARVYDHCHPRAHWKPEETASVASVDPLDPVDAGSDPGSRVPP